MVTLRVKNMEGGYDMNLKLNNIGEKKHVTCDEWHHQL